MNENVTSPSQEIVERNPANQRHTIKTADGKSVVVRRLSVLDQTRVIRAMGAEHSSNYLYREMVESAFMVEQVDSIYMARPKNEDQIDKLIGKLGDDVMASIMSWRTREILEAMRAADNAVWGDNTPLPEKSEDDTAKG